MTHIPTQYFGPLQLMQWRSVLELGHSAPKDAWLNAETVYRWGEDLTLEGIRMVDRIWGASVSKSANKENVETVSVELLMTRLHIFLDQGYRFKENPLSAMRRLFPKFQWQFKGYECVTDTLEKLKAFREWEMSDGSVIATSPLMIEKLSCRVSPTEYRAFIRKMAIESVRAI